MLRRRPLTAPQRLAPAHRAGKLTVCKQIKPEKRKADEEVPLTGFSVKDVVSAMDTKGQWYPAVVIAVEPTRAKVHFIGWNEFAAFEPLHRSRAQPV